MAETIGLRLRLWDDEIVVTLPGTIFAVSYRKSTGSSGLVTCSLTDDREIPISTADFLAHAWRLANDKARELGWIV